MDVTPEIREKYDTLLHMKNEAELPHAEVVAEAKKLFPGFNGIGVYDEILDAYAIECYQDARAKGLSIEESAHNAEVSNFIVTKALQGEGLSLDRFVSLIKAELTAKAKLITRMLNVIEKATSSTDVNAAAMLLEKIDPGRYGKAAAFAATTDRDGEKQGVVLNFTVASD